MRVCKILCSVAALACTVSSSPTNCLEASLQSLSERSCVAHVAVNEKRDGAELRILVAGASIASGYRSADGNGFRVQLRDALTAAGNEVQMVGTVEKSPNNAYVGHPGLRIDEVMAKLDGAIPNISPPPNIVLVQVGANDLGQKFKIAQMQDRISTLVDHVCTAIPGVNVVLSTLLPSGNTEDGVLVYNAQLREVAEAQNKQGRHVYISDVHSSDFSLADILPLPDGTHPTDEGYAKMARTYADTILEIVKVQVVPPPAPSTSSAPEVKSTSSTATSTTSAAIQIAKELRPSSTSTTETLAASTTGPVSTPTSTAPAQNGAGSLLGQSGSLLTTFAILAWTAPLFAI